MKSYFVKNLGSLLKGYSTSPVTCDVSGITMDSREVKQGDLFLACNGEASSGHRFARQAVASGAVAVVYEQPLPVGVTEAELQDLPVVTVAVEKLSERAGEIASRFYDNPSASMTVTGITGTNGKTSCCHFLAQILADSGVRCGVIGTLGNGIYGDLQAATHTTPDAVTIQRLLAKMRDRGALHVVMEVSSHGIQQQRIAGVQFDVAVFTNLSRDHLDYHGDMASYASTKKRLFSVPGLRFAVVNKDDATGREIFDSLAEGVNGFSYGFKALDSDICGYDLKLKADGFTMQIKRGSDEGSLKSHLLGGFNGSNLLAVLGVLLTQNMSFDDALHYMAKIRAVPGRMEIVGENPSWPLVVIDFAHTPDALQQVLQTLRLHCRGNLWCVFGCGGDRDRGKRSKMGSIVGDCADYAVITDDNPRFEPAGAIVEDILQGMRDSKLYSRRVRVINDRAQAIRYAIGSSSSSDTVLIAGKGDESYQIVNGHATPFSDREQALTALQEVA